MTGVGDLAAKSCQPCEGGSAALTSPDISALLVELDGWEQHGAFITKTYSFKDHYQAMAFVNAVAWISHRENHHPDLHLGYKQCRIEYTTHALDGLSENDFICAAKVDALFRL
ncbi:MAG: 4a-hydroxytetrahydrobiopterin dehydratase [Sulfuriferula sp.]